MKISIIRHGETDYNRDGIIQGSKFDLGLNELGKKQARELANEMSESFEVIFSSKLKRARETAEILAEKLKIPLEISDKIIERDFGSLTGKTWQNLVDEFGDKIKDRDYNQAYDYRIYGGESVDDVRARLNKFLREVKDKYQGHVLVVAHGGIIRLMHNIYSDQDKKIVGNVSVHEFHI